MLMVFYEDGDGACSQPWLMQLYSSTPALCILSCYCIKPFLGFVGPAGLHAAGGSWSCQDNCSIVTWNLGLLLTFEHLQCFEWVNSYRATPVWKYHIMTSGTGIIILWQVAPPHKKTFESMQCLLSICFSISPSLASKSAYYYITQVEFVNTYLLTPYIYPNCG